MIASVWNKTRERWDAVSPWIAWVFATGLFLWVGWTFAYGIFTRHDRHELFLVVASLLFVQGFDAYLRWVSGKPLSTEGLIALLILSLLLCGLWGEGRWNVSGAALWVSVALIGALWGRWSMRPVTPSPHEDSQSL